jgi:GT2 family glycosyltransferase
MKMIKCEIKDKDITIYKIGNSNSISVIIPVRKGLPKNLDAVKNQTFKDYEIIVVSGSGTPGSSHARNLGIKITKSKFLAFLDDDAYPEPDWLEQLLKAYYTGKGDVVDSEENSPKSIYFNFSKPLKNLQEKTYVNFGLYPRYVIDKVGLYDERFGKYGFNEVDYSIRIRKAGFRIIHCSKARVHHVYETRTLKYFPWKAFLHFTFKHPRHSLFLIMAYTPFLHPFWKKYIHQNTNLE